MVNNGSMIVKMGANDCNPDQMLAANRMELFKPLAFYKMKLRKNASDRNRTEASIRLRLRTTRISEPSDHLHTASGWPTRYTSPAHSLQFSFQNKTLIPATSGSRSHPIRTRALHQSPSQGQPNLGKVRDVHSKSLMRCAQPPCGSDLDKQCSMKVFSRPNVHALNHTVDLKAAFVGDQIKRCLTVPWTILEHRDPAHRRDRIQIKNKYYRRKTTRSFHPVNR